MDEESQSLEQELDNLSHEDLCEITQSSLRRLIAADPLLQDLPGDVTAEEVLSQIAVAQGKSITVTVLRHFDTPLHVVVSILKDFQYYLNLVLPENHSSFDHLYLPTWVDMLSLELIHTN